MVQPLDPSDKRPKLERARSAAEKENHPMQRTNSMLRRQYSQQEPPGRRMSTSDSGVEVSPGQRRMQPQLPQPYGQSAVDYRQQAHYGPGPQPSHMGPMPAQQPIPLYGGTTGHMTTESHLRQSSSMGYPDEDPRYYQVTSLSC